jgi:acyl-CoA thioester hydrolase
MTEYQYRLEFEVRDYECDLSGIVNNAVYQHYLEHARHVTMRRLGVDYAAVQQRGISLVVTRIELDFLYPLRSTDHFYVMTSASRVSRLRFGFRQDIFRLPDDLPILRGYVVGTGINARGRPELPPELEDILGKIPG